jgi:hypothetical protein
MWAGEMRKLRLQRKKSNECTERNRDEQGTEEHCRVQSMFQLVGSDCVFTLPQLHISVTL